MSISLWQREWTHISGHFVSVLERELRRMIGVCHQAWSKGMMWNTQPLEWSHCCCSLCCLHWGALSFPQNSDCLFLSGAEGDLESFLSSIFPKEMTLKMIFKSLWISMEKFFQTQKFPAGRWYIAMVKEQFEFLHVPTFFWTSTKAHLFLSYLSTQN